MVVNKQWAEEFNKQLEQKRREFEEVKELEPYITGMAEIIGDRAEYYCHSEYRGRLSVMLKIDTVGQLAVLLKDLPLLPVGIYEHGIRSTHFDTLDCLNSEFEADITRMSDPDSFKGKVSPIEPVIFNLGADAPNCHYNCYLKVCERVIECEFFPRDIGLFCSRSHRSKWKELGVDYRKADTIPDSFSYTAPIVLPDNIMYAGSDEYPGMVILYKRK